MASKTGKVVSRDPEVVSGELVFAGTRVPAKNLVDYLKAGDTFDVFLNDFPSVTRQQVVAYLETSVEAVDTLRERDAHAAR